MTMRYFLFFSCFLICLLLPFHSNAQTFIDFEYKNGHTKCTCNNIPAKKVLDTLDAIKNERFLACCYHCIGTYYYNDAGEDWEAIKYHKKALKIREKYQDKLLWKSYRNIAYASYEIWYYEGVIEAILKGFEVSDELKETVTYNYLGESYIELGEFEKAVEALKNSLNLAEDNYDLAEANNSLCIALTRTKDSLNLLKALEHAEEAIKLFEDIEHTVGVAKACLNKGYTLDDLKQYEAAIQSYNQAKEIFSQKNYTLYLSKTINNIAATLYAQGRYKEAIEKLNESLKIKKEYYDNDTFQYTYSANYENLAENYEALGNIGKALEYYQLALINLTDNFRNQDINTNPKVTSNHYIYSKPYLIQALDLKAQAALKSGNTDLAYDTYQVLDEWINEFYKDLSTNESKLTWIARTHDIYTNAIEVALKKEDQAKAFEYAEKAQAVLLWQSHSQQAALSLLDDEERENYDNLLAQIRQADYEYRDAADENKTQVKSTLDLLNREFDQFEKTLNDTNSEYAQRKYQPKTITLNDVQTNILNNTTALVEYHWSADDILYIFTLTKNEMYIDTIRVDATFHNNIREFYITLKDYKSDIIEFGYPIYQKAFAPVYTHLNEKHKNIKKIILLPDSKLNYLPFEALPTSPTDNVFNIPYLINDYTFNYLYSCSSYRSLSVANTIQTALYIAPRFGEKDNLPVLKKTEVAEELEALGLKLAKLTGKQATRHDVIKEMRDVDVIHFHTHAEQGEKGTGKIHLYKGDELTQAEIQELALNKPPLHVVISACETGTGELSKGEGVLSLGWSFVYRGVPSVVMSLWKVNETSTSDLMKNYYEYLNEGMSGDVQIIVNISSY